MRLIEEKSIISLNICTIIFILMASIGIEVSNYQISNNNNEMDKLVLGMIVNQELKNGEALIEAFLTTYEIWGVELKPMKEENLPYDIYKKRDDYISDEKIDLDKQFRDGEITGKEYLDKRLYSSRKKVEDYRTTHNEIYEQLNEKLKKANFRIWEIVRSICLILQFIGIFVLLKGNYKLYNLVEGRVYKKTSNLNATEDAQSEK